MANYPLVRAMLAGVYNNSFLCTHPKHNDIKAEDISMAWVAETRTYYPCTEQDIQAAELLLETQPQGEDLAAQLWDGRSDDQINPILVLVGNAYCEHLGLI